MKVASVAIFAVLLVLVSSANAQIGDSTSFGSKNTFSTFVEYSNDSSHIVLGSAPDRKLTSLGLQYERRLVSSHSVVWKYAVEFRPLIFESDPTAILTETITAPPPVSVFSTAPQAVTRCAPASRRFSGIDPTTGIMFTGTLQTTCSRRWTYAQGFAPIGTRVNFLSHHRVQPTASFFGGFMVSAKEIPYNTAGSFNFTFEFGAGVEYYHSQSRSMRLEYQIQHFSNANTAVSNPGVDSGLFKFTYTFGR
jgi:hypothetical protein